MKKEMKKFVSTLLVAMVSVSMLAACGSATKDTVSEEQEQTESVNAGEETTSAESESAEEETAASTWIPEKAVSLICCSSAGGGSDINCRAVIEDFGKIGIDADFVVDYKNDGGGAIGWQYTAKATDEYTVMCYGFGDTINMVDNTEEYRMDAYKGVAIVSAEQEVLLSSKNCKYADFNEAVEAAKNGTVVTIAGSGGVDLIIYKKLLETTGLTEAQLSYIQHNSTGEAIVTMLGDHSDYVVCKPSSSISYVESGELVPYVAFNKERFSAPLENAPTISELGYEAIEAPMWRGFVVSKDMPDEAYQYYCDIFQQLVDSDEWMTDYVEANAATPLFMTGEEADTYMREAEAAYIEESK